MVQFQIECASAKRRRLEAASIPTGFWIWRELVCTLHRRFLHPVRQVYKILEEARASQYLQQCNSTILQVRFEKRHSPNACSACIAVTNYLLVKKKHVKQRAGGNALLPLLLILLRHPRGTCVRTCVFVLKHREISTAKQMHLLTQLLVFKAK